ncbi:dicarboxylate/amino acid:cation symporter [SCandidatus Aminicenantes bacterium Aminicenantia_JdfR_composite]|nr:dicarboxylate/amino acid:cation symporter [SCandidatus Aminicenantes bacterium Aminicenantia_JdfR_composite]MCP2597328.1 dicarboxylate/amino acid:cation symporter [Candidatus Aminicenantes bacterium AC-335-G13]MCP2606393.1 dicarboxylate/amino acid:cation symporter [Candidatus Aminicenantes bacterium AC-708-I09]
MLQKIKKIGLSTQVGIGMLLGFGVGLIFGEKVSFLEFFGRAFIKLILVVIIPLVFASLTIGLTSIPNFRKFGRIGIKTVIVFILGISLAILISFGCALLLKPGSTFNLAEKESLIKDYKPVTLQKIEKTKEKPSFSEIILDFIPSNPIKSAAEGHLLQIIIFTILFGISLNKIPKEYSEAILKVISAINRSMIVILNWILKLAPFGVFALIAPITGKLGFSIIFSLLKYTLVFLIAIILQLGIVYSLSLYFLGLNSLKFFKAIRPAQLIAFGTTSSLATLPVSMKCAEDMGISNEVKSFVLPLLATLYRDGTGIYQVVSVIFLVQIYNVNFSLKVFLITFFLVLIGAITTASVPAGGFINLTIILSSIGVPLEGLALILGVERILDMLRTTVNVTGQLTWTTFVASSEGEKLLISRTS